MIRMADLEAFLGPFHQRIVDAHAARPAIRDATRDDRRQHPEGQDFAEQIERRSRAALHHDVADREDEVGEPHRDGRGRGPAAQRRAVVAGLVNDRGARLQGDRLGVAIMRDFRQEPRRGDGGDRRTPTGDPGRKQDTRGVAGSECRADGDRTGRQDREPGGIDRQEQDHVVARGPLLLMQAAEFLHRLDPEGRRGIPQPEHVAGNVHDHRAHRGMALGNAGK